jgi:hypothetical protein
MQSSGLLQEDAAENRPMVRGEEESCFKGSGREKPGSNTYAVRDSLRRLSVLRALSRASTLRALNTLV